jgi:hypothetical protein
MRTDPHMSLELVSGKSLTEYLAGTMLSSRSENAHRRTQSMIGDLHGATSTQRGESAAGYIEKPPTLSYLGKSLHRLHNINLMSSHLHPRYFTTWTKIWAPHSECCLLGKAAEYFGASMCYARIVQVWQPFGSCFKTPLCSNL